MHPIEHLRYVARARGVDPATLVEESAHALGSLRFDPSGVVVACRRIVERHPFTGPLWWLCSGICVSAEPFDAVRELASDIRNDRTGANLAAELPDDATVVTIGDPHTVAAGLIRRGDVEVLAFDVQHEASSFVRRLERADVDVEPLDAGVAGAAVRTTDVVLVDALALDGTRVAAPIGSSTIAGLASANGIECWLVAGKGTRLPSGYVDAMERTLEQMGADAAPWDLDAEILPTSRFTHVVGPHGRLPMGPSATTAESPYTPELLRPSPI